MSRKTKELRNQLQQFSDLRAGRIKAALGQSLFDRRETVPPGQRGGDLVDLVERQAKCLADVADRALGAVAGHGGGQCGAFAAVLGVDVLDHFLAALVFEVDVDVGRLVALARNEALEQQVAARRVDFGDAQRIADRRIGGRATPLAEDLLRTRKAHDVVDGQEVGLVSEFADQRQFVFDLRAHRGRFAARPALAHAGFGQFAQMFAGTASVRNHLMRILVPQVV